MNYAAVLVARWAATYIHSSREGNFKVFVMNDDGSSVTRVTDHPAGDGYSTWRP